MYISQASNFRNFRDLSKIVKLNTRKFLELPINMILSA